MPVMPVTAEKIMDEVHSTIDHHVKDSAWSDLIRASLSEPVKSLEGALGRVDDEAEDADGELTAPAEFSRIIAGAEDYNIVPELGWDWVLDILSDDPAEAVALHRQSAKFPVADLVTVEDVFNAVACGFVYEHAKEVWYFALQNAGHLI